VDISRLIFAFSFHSLEKEQSYSKVSSTHKYCPAHLWQLNSHITSFFTLNVFRNVRIYLRPLRQVQIKVSPFRRFLTSVWCAAYGCILVPSGGSKCIKEAQEAARNEQVNEGNRNYTLWTKQRTITVALLSEAWTVFVRSNAGIVGSNQTRGVDVFVRLFSVYVATLRQANPQSRESYRLCIVLETEKSTKFHKGY
jgi:hypothetical protein